MDSAAYSQKIRVETVKLLYQQLSIGLWSESLAAISLFVALYGAINTLTLSLWLAFNLLFCGVFRHTLVYLFKRSPVENNAYWLRLFTLGTLFSGINWGAIGWVLMVNNDMLRQSFEVFLLIGVIAASNPLYSPSRSTYALFIFPALMPLLIHFFIQGGIFMMLGILCFAYLAIMLATSSYSYHLIYSSFKLRFENKELLEKLLHRDTQHTSTTFSNRELLLERLATAIQKKQLFLVYQPIFSMSTGYITGVEALVRWQEPELGLIPPNVFIPIAEEGNLIIPISNWIMREACRQGKRWQNQGIMPLQLSINLSSHQFKQPDFFDEVCRILGETQFSAEHLAFELTESSIMEDVDNNIAILNKMKTMGITISIDDFGVGYSSLNYLKRLPVDKLKIDRSFVQDIPHHPDDVAIVSAIIALGTTLKLTLVAEGVENEEQLQFLIECGCHEIQGFYLAKPLDVDICTARLLEKVMPA